MKVLFRRYLPALILGACSLGTPRTATADTDYGQVASWVTHLLQEHHYSRQDFDDEMSKKALRHYLELLDVEKMYFTKPEIEKFRSQFDTQLDDLVFSNDLTPAHQIYDLFMKKLRERFGKVKSLLEGGQLDFSGAGTTAITRKDAEYCPDDAALDKLWVGRITNEVMAERIRIALAKEKKEKAATEKKEGAKPAEAAPADGEKKEGEAPKADAAKSAAPAKPVDTPEQKIVKRYKRFLDAMEENDEEDVANFFLSAISQAYDPHSEYLSAPEKDNFDIEMNKKLEGIGAVLSMRDGAAEIDRLVSGAPAHLSGELKVHDRIVGVAQGSEGEMEDVEGMKLNKVVEKIRGERGTTLRLKVIPAADPTTTKEVVLKRAQVDLKESLAKADLIETKDSKGEKVRIGWILIDSFYADMERHTVSVTRDVRRLVQRLMKENVSGLVIDLRGNGGGSLEEAINLTGLFIKKGPVVQQKSWNGALDTRSSRSQEPLYAGPLCVLTDRTSASASEIFAAALQDHGRAVVVGDKSTFGKGTVQTILDVRKYMPVFSKADRAGSLKVTIQKFYRVAGGSTQLKGVVPDLILPSRLDALEIGEEALKEPLPYDTIRKLDYDLADCAPLPTTELRSRMDVRVKKDPEFTYVQEDVKRLKDQIDKNTLTLNEQERLAEIRKNKDRNKQRSEERKGRLEDVKTSYSVFRLTQENVDQEDLVSFDKAKDDEKGGMIMAKDDDEDEDDTDEFPYDIEPVKAETLNIVKDLIQMSNEARTVKVGAAEPPKK